MRLSMADRSMNRAEWGILLALALLWGGSFLFIAVGVSALPPLTLVLLRVGLAALVLVAVVRATGERLPTDPRLWAAFAGMALLNNLAPFSLFAWGQTQIASGLASILNATTPLWAVIVGQMFTTDEKATPLKLAGVAVGIAGVAAMIGADALGGLGSNVAAQLACLGATLSYALAGVYGRRFRGLGVPPLVAATGQLAAAALILLPVELIVDRPWTLPVPGAPVLAAIAGLVLLSTALAYVLYFRLLATAGATNVMLVTFLIPVTAILLGAVVLGEVLRPQHALGLAGIALGLLLIDGRLFRRLRH
jgi:drug/metabolite transporter (DMT)-like permease